MVALPDDIVTEIFSYLPAKSVGRFSCASREWHATLSSASFVYLHLRLANKPGEVKVFLSLPPEEEPYHHDDDTMEEEPYHDDGTMDADASEQEPSIDDNNTPEQASYHDDATSEEEEESSDDDNEEEESYFYDWQPGGVATKLTTNNFLRPIPLTRPLHGLVLILDTGYHVFNPCTGASLALPDTEQPAKMIDRPTFQEGVLPQYEHVAYGLGYCSVTGEYKVVRLFSDDDEYSLIHCEVFVLGTLSYWRPAAQQPPVCVVEENMSVFVNGRLHFLCHDGGIIAFDVSHEMFDSVLPPQPSPEDAPIELMELDGCLCVCHGHVGYTDNTYHIWVLRNYKQGEWEQLCRIDPTTWTEPLKMQLKSSWIIPLSMYNRDNGHNKMIMFATGTCTVFAVDVPHGNTPKVLFNPNETTDRFEDYYDPVLGLFEESLVPVGRTIYEMVLSSPKTKAWFDILKWMPTRSVAKLSLVCRAWRAMVKDDHFIQSHVAHANLNRSPRIMMITDSTFGRYNDLEDIVNGPPCFSLSLHFVCSQPCHGLNAGTMGSRSFVCNPVRGHVENIVLDGVDDDAFFAGQTGLGYNLKNNKHMLVLVTYKEKNLAKREYQLECKLRYVDEQECRSIDPPPRPVADAAPTYMDGKILWLVEPNLGPVSLNYEIVAFDVQTEEFDILQGPPCSSSHDNGHMSILQLRGALCVACSDKSSNVIDIWMMKNVGIWSVEYHIELEEFSPEYSSERTTPLAINPVDGRILLSTGQSLGYYDPEAAAMETLYRYVNARWKFCPVICEESFVSTLWDASFLREP
ncbi:unnamed protein product [Alopecurus aequalis]